MIIIHIYIYMYMQKYTYICYKYDISSRFVCFGHFLHLNPPLFLYQWGPLLRLRREAWHSARTRPMVPVPWGPRVSWDFGRLLSYKTPGFQPAKGKTTVYFLWGFSCSDGIHGRVDILRRYMKVPLSISSVPFYSIFANDHLYNHNIIIQLPNTIPQHDPKWRYIYHSNGVWQHHWAWWWLNNSPPKPQVRYPPFGGISRKTNLVNTTNLKCDHGSTTASLWSL